MEPSTARKTKRRLISALVVVFTLALVAILPRQAVTQPSRRASPVAGTAGWTNSIGMTFIRVEPGRFTMGTPEQKANRFTNEQRHEVRITRAYSLAIYEVTRGQFRAFVNETGYKTDAEKEFQNALCAPGHPRPRVINVDGNPSYPKVVAELKAEGKLGRRCRCRTCPYLNNIVE